MKAKKATTIASKVKQAEMVAQENQNKPKAAKKKYENIDFMLI